MRRGSSLLIIMGLFILLIAGAGAYLYLFAPALTGDTAAQAPIPTPLPDVEVVQAAIDIEAGTLIDDPATWLTLGSISGEEYAANSGSYLVNVEEARDLKTMVAIAGNQPVRQEQLGPPGLALKIPTPVPGQSPLKAFPVQVNSLTGVADMIEPGDYVDLMASFNLDVITFRPGVPVNKDEGTMQDVLVEQMGNEGSVKVLLQDVEVLDIVKPVAVQPTPEGGEGGEAEQPQAVAAEPTPQSMQVAKNTDGTVLKNGNWVLIIGVTNQEAEVLRFALDRGIGISTLLRATGDHTTERTVGSTLRILIDNYGMPLPSGMPPVQQPGPVQVPEVPELPQVPIDAYAPTAAASTEQ